MTPRWLTADEQRTWRAFIRTVHLIDAALDAQLQQDAGITHIQYSILAMLSEAPDRSLRMTELADVTESSRSRLSHAVSRLEGLGWVERRVCPTDKRGQIAALTDDGFAVLESAAPGHVERVRTSIFDVISMDEAATLGDLLGRVAASLEAEQVGRGPDD